MKVKELIEKLQKENPEDEIHIWVDDEVGCGADLFGRYYASEIKIQGYDKYYQKENGELKNMEELEEEIYDEYENISDEEIKKEALIFADKLQKLEGCWIAIKL